MKRKGFGIDGVVKRGRRRDCKRVLIKVLKQCAKQGVMSNEL